MKRIANLNEGEKGAKGLKMRGGNILVYGIFFVKQSFEQIKDCG